MNAFGLQLLKSDSWISIDDRVMGGVSKSQMLSDGDTLVFTGTLSLENNGGFASVRSLITLKDAEPKSLLRITVKGDGKAYQLRFRTDRYMDGVAYAASFETTKDELVEVIFKLEDFFPVWRGRRLDNIKPLAWDEVSQIGLMITQKQAGEFRLEVKEIEWLNSSSL